jgi:hypothetical protein
MGQRNGERMPKVVTTAVALGLMAGVTTACGNQAESSAPSSEPTAEQTVRPESTPTPSSKEKQPSASSLGRAAIRKNVIITFYAAFDNDPPGTRAVAHPDVQPKAGGTGTYEDPLTLAARSDVSKEFKPGTEVYVPFLRKYFVRADDCGESSFAPDGCETQIDLYMGNPSAKEAVIDCEYELTPDTKQVVIIDPPEDLPVSAQPLWSDTTEVCFGE